jgi:hypothetical protein
VLETLPLNGNLCFLPAPDDTFISSKPRRAFYKTGGLSGQNGA